MKARAIHQVLAGFAPGDAISNQALQIQRRLRAWGYVSNLYAEHRDPGVTFACEDYRRLQADASTIVILHYSIATVALDLFLQSPARQVVYYHNITPARYLHGYNSRMESALTDGRAGLKLLSAVPYILAGSEYNAAELAELGFQPATVLPYFIDLERLHSDPHTRVGRKVQELFGDTSAWVNLLFVGRIIPNKRQEDLIRLFAYYQRLVRPNSRLLLVGSDINGEGYAAQLEGMIESLGLREVYLTGLVSPDELVAYYRAASVFVCMSEHEGFCVPIIEAMEMGVPVLAYAAAAVPGTMGSAGVLAHRKQLEPLAEMVELLVSDIPLRRRVIQHQHEHAQSFRPEQVEARLRQVIEWIVAD